MNKLDLAYLAGFFDGEGCIHYSFKKHSHCRKVSSECWIQLTSTNQTIVESLKTDFGGFTFSYKLYKRRKIVYTWKVAARKLFPVLRLLEPYMRIKRDHARLLLDHQQIITKPGQRSDEEKQVLFALTEKSSKFNQRGPTSDEQADYDYSVDRLTGKPRFQKDPARLVDYTPPKVKNTPSEK